MNSEFERDERGLLKGVEYKFLANGKVDWRAMISPEYIVPNKENLAKRNVDLSTVKISDLEDKDLVILLGGIRQVAELRGYTDLKPRCVVAQPDFVAVETQITWIPNFETGGLVRSYGDGADAHPMNTNGFSRVYLTAIAFNRAFCRVVRNSLNINIVSFDELGANQKSLATSEDNSPKPIDSLRKLLGDNNIKFSTLQNRLIQNKVEGTELWNSVENVPVERVFEIMEFVKKLLLDKKKAKKIESVPS